MDEQGRSSCNFEDSATLDRLSELPESLLVRIISQLPMEDAVRTGALSTRWKNLWKHVDEITVNHPIQRLYDDCPFMPYDVMVKEFVSIVNGTLIQYSRRNIKRFALLVEYVYDIANEVLDEWFQWVYLRKVEILTLKLPMSVYSAPEWFCHNSSLSKLDIEGPADIKFRDEVVNWASLRSLSLTSVDISDEDISKVLLGCPMLETLVLIHVSGVSKLNIVSSKVKELRVIDRRNGNEEWFEVNAPWLEHLEISGSYRGAVLRLKDVSSLQKVSLTFECMDHCYRLFDVDSFLAREVPILESVRHVEELTFGREFIQVLSVLKMLGKPCPLFKCKLLTLNLRAFKHELPGIVYLLQNSPCLETIVVRVEAPTTWEDNIGNFLKGACEFDGAMFLSSQSVDFHFQHLKRMKISRNFYSCPRNDASRNIKQFDFELAAHVVVYARSLESLVVELPRKEETSCDCSTNCVSEYFSILSSQYLQIFSDFGPVGEWKLTENRSSFEIVYNTSDEVAL